MSQQPQPSQVPASQKTAEQRKAELSSALQSLGATMPADKVQSAIPADVVKIVEILKGQPVNVGDILVDHVPEADKWREATTKQGKSIYVALDTFGLRDLVKIGNRMLCIKVSLVIK